MRRIALSLIVVVACARCASAQEPKPGSPADAKPKDELKPWAEAIKDARPYTGFLKLHLRKDNALLLEIEDGQLDKDFGMVVHLARGVGDFNLIGGLPVSGGELVRLRRVGNQILLVQTNAAFLAEAGSPMRRSLDDNLGHSILAAFKVESERPDKKAVLVDISAFLVSDYADFAQDLKPYFVEAPGTAPPTFDKERSFVAAVQDFPRNVELDATLTFKVGQVPKSGGATVSDWRSIPVGVRYSFFALPEKRMVPRLADPRIGFFTQTFHDFSRDRTSDGHVGYARRWRLDKKVPGAAPSAPVQPIVYYIDRSVPTEYRRYVKEGIEAWNAAFEQAGFSGAVVAKDAPDDPTWSADDIRYSTVRWSAAYVMGYAIGPSQTDPRTGEILNADILIWSEIPRGIANTYRELSGPEPPSACSAATALASDVALGSLLAGAVPMSEEYMGEAIRWFVMHEVGHTLGLRHNFRGSAGVPNDKLNDRGFTKANGVVVSVMDYPTVNVASDPARQGDHYNPGVGSYDVWAIRYGYSDTDAAGLARIAAEAKDPLHMFGTDEDAMGSYGVDPLTQRWDLGADPVAFAAERVKLIDQTLPRLERRVAGNPDPYERLREATKVLIGGRTQALHAAIPSVGGLYFTRGRAGDAAPFTPVPADKQRRALELVVQQGLVEGAYAIPPDLLNRAAPRRVSQLASGLEMPMDLPVHRMVQAMQEGLVDALLDPVRLTRILDNELRVPAAERFTMVEIFDKLSGAIFSEVAARRSVSSFRRNLQRAYVDRLVGLLVRPPPPPAASPPVMWFRQGLTPQMPVPEDARSLARFHLGKLDGQIAQALRGKPDVMTRAHLEETHARIQRALSASMTLDADRPTAPR